MLLQAYKQGWYYTKLLQLEINLQNGFLQPHNIFNQCSRVLETFITLKATALRRAPNLVRSQGLAAAGNWSDWREGSEVTTLWMEGGRWC